MAVPGHPRLYGENLSPKEGVGDGGNSVSCLDGRMYLDWAFLCWEGLESRCNLTS